MNAIKQKGETDSYLLFDEFVRFWNTISSELSYLIIWVRGRL